MVVWESKSMAYTAATLNQQGEPIGIKEPRFFIKEGEYKGNKVYRLYERNLNHTRYLVRNRKLDVLIKTAESFE